MNKDKKISNQQWGMIAGILAYAMWGVLPFYWKSLSSVAPLAVLSYRVIWSCGFMLLVLVLSRQVTNFVSETQELLKNQRRLLAVVAGAVLVTTNWFIFIFTVSNGKVIDASLGYYMNPLVNVLLATVFLKERLGRGELMACGLAALGVSLLAISTGAIPWSSLAMAVTFSAYGLLKKVAKVSSLTGLTIETAIIAPFALIYVVFFSKAGFMSYSLPINLLLVGAGVVTAIPLFLFAETTKRLPYILVGFLQYIAPTLMLLGAVFQFNESFAWPQLLGFSCIWLGILVFTYSKVLFYKKSKRM
ncbi:EamA family transporter RarD [Vagococcus salmoninarum]|uniref:EamA family transporter RarD n=1 Tax=Vagococcus salmoninarum TaxID=2739 RepID=UPI003F9E4B40